MRFAVNIIVLMSAVTAAAFDSEAWLGKRELLTREAERLQRAYADTSRRIDSPAENVTVPLESFDDGSVKTSVTAGKAQFFLDTGFVWAEAVVLKTLDGKGGVDARVDAKNCLVDRSDEARSGWIEGRARAKHGKMTLEGESVYLSFAEQYIAVMSNAVVTADDLDFGKSKNSGGMVRGRTTLRADRADYDRGEGVIMFDGNVRLDSKEYNLVADQAFAFVNGTNELRRIVAVGNVAITNGLRSGYCDRTVYSRYDSKVAMYAGENSPARLMDTDDGRRREVAGDKITFHLDSEQVEVLRPVMTVEAGKEDFKL